MEKIHEETTGMLRVAITGPESSGKTSLAEALTQHYNAVMIPEYAREYLSELTRPYTIKDLDIISRKQLEMELQAQDQPVDIIFYDTDVLVLKIWYEHKFNEVPEWLLKTLETGPYDFHLLLRPDIPYEPDPLRENPDKGEYFFNKFLYELNRYGFPYQIVEGPLDQRFNKAKEAIDNYINGFK
jgi:nicotinamide riboside kinase